MDLISKTCMIDMAFIKEIIVILVILFMEHLGVLRITINVWFKNPLHYIIW